MGLGSFVVPRVQLVYKGPRPDHTARMLGAHLEEVRALKSFEAEVIKLEVAVVDDGLDHGSESRQVVGGGRQCG